ncbi:hypothetical protein SCOCK_100029 [Actinacidiphila cocklensis]|uniref:Uncharacterized protein n=1 Tax=Actinacidiphila cocklensis TaxID=887465 RepID=A0A9W4E0D2_9ACTN|nr:hypothetical protein SCOCK_100029 [Actinacidiphila cocklensis]
MPREVSFARMPPVKEPESARNGCGQRGGCPVGRPRISRAPVPWHVGEAKSNGLSKSTHVTCKLRREPRRVACRGAEEEAGKGDSGNQPSAGRGVQPGGRPGRDTHRGSGQPGGTGPAHRSDQPDRL